MIAGRAGAAGGWAGGSWPLEVPPLAADPGGVADLAAGLEAAAARFDDLDSFLGGPAGVPGWSGLAASAYHADLAPRRDDVEAMSRALRTVATEVTAYADALAVLQVRREHLVTERAALMALLARTAAPPGADLGPVWARLGRFETDVANWEAEVADRGAAVAGTFAASAAWAREAACRTGAAVAAAPPGPALATMPGGEAPPGEVHAWWRGLTEAARLTVIAAAPGLVGNLAGIPAAARHAANAAALAGDLARLCAVSRRTRTDAEQERLDNALAAREALDRVADGEDPVTGRPWRATLLVYDPVAFGGDGRTAIAVGDLDTASDVAVVVPGFGTDAGSAPVQVDRALTLHDATRDLHPGSVATVAWIGYDAPDNLLPDLDGLGVVREDLAARGGERLADELDGLRASRPGNPAHLTVVGNSYGSTTTAVGATVTGLAADELVLVGSPGAGGGADHAADLGVGAGHVWVAAASHDPVSGLADNGWVGGGTLAGAGLGDDPAEDDFGARRIRAESPWRGEGGVLADHARYFDRGSESLANISHVVAGEYDRVGLAGHRHDPWWGPPLDPEAVRTP